MNTRIAISAAILTAFATANAGSGAFVTFEDGGNTTFTRTPTTGNLGTLTASGTGFTLLLATADPLVKDSLTGIDFTSNGVLNYESTVGGDPESNAIFTPGSITFSKLGIELFTINFDSATLDSDGFRGEASNGFDNVTFSGPLVTSRYTVTGSQGFGFGFANGTSLPNGGFSYSSSFSASGDYTINAVPEPASMAALGIGALALLRRRRRA